MPCAGTCDDVHEVSSVAPNAPKLLAADDVRIDVDGVPACDGLGFETRGSHVLLLGAPRALFEATSGLTPVVRGSLRVRGELAERAARRCIVAGAAQDAPLPPRWKVVEYIEWSARLAGVPALEARRSSAAAIEKLRLEPLARTETSRLVAHGRRATLVAAALATCAEVIALDDPLGGLSDETAATYAAVLAEALRDRAWVVFAPRMPLGSVLAASADEAIVASASRVEAQGTPADIAAAVRRFVVRLDGPADVVLAELERRGGRVELQGAHLVLNLGEALSARELVSLCAAADVSVIELVPVARALT